MFVNKLGLFIKLIELSNASYKTDNNQGQTNLLE